MHKLTNHYPRLTTIALSYVLVWLVFILVGPTIVHQLVEPLGVGGIILAGMMYTYGFTASISTVLLPSFSTDYPIGLIAVVGGMGAMLVDLMILRYIKKDLKGEIHRLETHTFLKRLAKIPFMRTAWLRTILGFAVIASPFPDELGIAILAGVKIPNETFRIVSLIANIAGIYALVTIGSGFF